MKIRDIHIDGFGIFHNRSLSDISPHLTIILGDNESGKSTLLAFIRRVLFGFPSKRKGGNHYEPLNGGEQGGRIGVTTDSNRDYEIIRYEKKSKGLLIQDKEGVSAGNALTVVAGGADQAFFENVFAFGLGELESFDTLSDDAVQNRLMSAGAGVTKIPVPEVQKLLDKHIEGYYKKGTRKPRVPDILKQISDNEGTLSTISETQDEYDSLSTELEEIEANTGRLITEKQGMERTLHRNENIIHIWDEWVTFEETEEILTSLDVPESFPDDGIQQLHMIDAEIGHAEDRQRELVRRLEEEVSEAENITIDDRLFYEQDRIRALEKKLTLWEADHASLPEINADLTVSEKACTELLKSIDPRWTTETLLSFDASLPAQHKVLQYQKQLEDISKQKAVLSTELNQYESLVSSEKDAIERRSGELPDGMSALSEDKLQAQEHALVELTEALPALEQKKKDLSSLQEEAAKRTEAFREQAALSKVTLPTWPGYLMAGAAIVGLGIGYVTDALLLGAIFCAVLGISTLVYLKAASVASQKSPDFPEEETNGAGISHLIEERREEITSLETTAHRLAEMCEFQGIPSVQAASRKSIELLELRKAFERKMAITGEIAHRQQIISGLENKISELHGKIGTEKAEEESVYAEWQEWLNGAGLDLSLSPSSVEKIFTLSERASEKYREMHALTTKKEGKIRATDEFNDEVTAAIHACGISSRGSPEADVSALTDALEEQLAKRRAQESHRKEIGRLHRESGQEDELIAAKREGRRDLLRSSHADTREEFLKHAETTKIHKECMRRRTEAEHRLKVAADNPAVYDAFLEELRQTGLHELEDMNATISPRIIEIENEINILQQRHGSVAQRLNGMENEDEAVLLRMNIAALTGDLNDASREWAKLVIARIMLRKGIEKYEKERQPAVFKEAERYFQSVTGGRYIRVIQPIGSDKILVEDQKGMRIPAALLSRGTAEQLYLSLRFGYITEYGNHDEHLPAVFDDILVNFDPERRQRSCEAIAELSNKNQVIFFTCHPDTAQMLQSARPDARLIEL
ncbi:AAA family ATPase [Methanogenium marinum]|uniref:AAA family ATPase n=1 Tax=Methanogenium marinum TaxID=348610 RepID=A0A9Q4PXH3_9EURY|nr:AAA family ATPase [Methanogenium marinum]MDE4908636.1 AAA family ATPase [Methanogenium marinum]